MTTAAQYAKALFESGQPDLALVRAALQRRGHEKLLPSIFAEYQKLLLQKERREAAQKVTPEQERTRILLELYNKLTTSTASAQ